MIWCVGIDGSNLISDDILCKHMCSFLVDITSFVTKWSGNASWQYFMLIQRYVFGFCSNDWVLSWTLPWRSCWLKCVRITTKTNLLLKQSLQSTDKNVQVHVCYTAYLFLKWKEPGRKNRENDTTKEIGNNMRQKYKCKTSASRPTLGVHHFRPKRFPKRDEWFPKFDRRKS